MDKENKNQKNIYRYKKILDENPFCFLIKN